MFQFIASYTQRKTYQRITRTLKIFQARFNVCFIVRQSPEILAIFHFRAAYKWEDMSRKFPCVLFCHTYDAFNFPLSHPGSGRGLCVSFLTPTQIDPRVDMGRTRERIFRGGAVDFMILNVHPSIQSFPSANFPVLIPRLRWKRWILSRPSPSLDHPWSSRPSQSLRRVLDRETRYFESKSPFSPYV